MPVYCLRCMACGHTFEEFIPCSRRDQACCEVCHGPVETDVQAQGFPGLGAIRHWEGVEGRSLSLGTTPDQIPNEMRRCPSAKFDPVTGDMLFDSDSHHRRVLKEMQAADARDAQAAQEQPHGV